MLVTLLAASLAVTAPVPKAAPFPLRTDPLPKEFKGTDLAAAARPKEVKGPVAVLAWKRIVSDDSTSSWTATDELALVLKSVEDADGKHRRFQLTVLHRGSTDAEWQVKIQPPPTPPGDLSEAFMNGSQGYAHPPTDKELATFLADAGWKTALGAKELTLADGKATVTTRLTGGGFNRDGWGKTFDRDPPTDLFPELKTQEK